MHHIPLISHVVFAAKTQEQVRPVVSRSKSINARQLSHHRRPFGQSSEDTLCAL